MSRKWKSKGNDVSVSFDSDKKVVYVNGEFIAVDQAATGTVTNTQGETTSVNLALAFTGSKGNPNDRISTLERNITILADALIAGNSAGLVSGTTVSPTSVQALAADGNALEVSNDTITLRKGDGSTESVSIADANTTYSAGNGISLSGTTFSVAAGGGLVQDASGLSHADTSSASNLSASGRRYVTGLTFDAYGHVTGYTTGTETVVNTDTNTTYSAGNGIGLSGTTFSVAAGNGLSQTTTGLAMSGSFTGNFTATGDITAYSDDRLKTNVKTIDGALDKVSRVRGVTFERIEDGSVSTGVVAQELAAVLPEAVKTDANGMHHVAYGNITGLLIEAVKELSAQVEELKSLHRI